MKTVRTIIGTFDRELAIELIKRYHLCGGDMVRYNGRDYVKSFIKYLIQYLQTQFDLPDLK